MQQRTDFADLKPRPASQGRALWMSTLAFTVCFAVWTIFSIIGVRIKDELGLSETEFGLLVGTPILTGSLCAHLARHLDGPLRRPRRLHADHAGDQRRHRAARLRAHLHADTARRARRRPCRRLVRRRRGLCLALLSAGRQGTALGIFGVGNVGAAVTKFVAPFVLLAWGWQAVALVWAAVARGHGRRVLVHHVRRPGAHRAPQDRRRAPSRFMLELSALRDVRVWRFAFYYFFVFGAFVALALWLPRYLIGVYGFDIATAGMIGALYSIPASIFRAYGGVLSDRVGARTVMYWSLGVSAVATLILSLPPTNYGDARHQRRHRLHLEIGVGGFIVATFVLGFFMSLGKAAVFKHIATYYPDNVGAVGGLVGMIGGLGGFVLPIAFGALNDLTGLWSSCFMLLFAIVVRPAGVDGRRHPPHAARRPAPAAEPSPPVRTYAAE